MEYLAGETLAERLRRGPVPLAQALELGAQVADALDVAHKHGIIHRDLKPGNVMLTAGGSGRSGAVSAKLLDFGLAKLAAHGERPALASDASAPTQTLPMTVRGTIVGTLQYMAPEQLEGKEADARTDLWALGALLYEMVTGKRAFDAESDVSLIGAILNTEPAGLATLQPLTPPSMERLVARCLAKHPDDRWDTAHDVADELRWIAQSSSSSIAVRGQQSNRRRWLALTGWAAAIVAIALLAAVLGARFGLPGIGTQRGAPATKVAHLDLVLPPDAPFWVDPMGFSPSFALSPDGAVIAYTCVRGDSTQICLRRLDRPDVSPIAGTEGGRYPVFSPDGGSVIFCVATKHSYCESGGPVKRLSVVNARVDTLGVVPDDSPAPISLEPTVDGQILLSGFLGIWTMPRSGGVFTALVRADTTRGEISFSLPALLPGGQRMIFSVARQEKNGYRWEVRVLTFATGEQRVILKDAAMARYLPTGHLLYRESPDSPRIMVAPFDAARLEVGSSVALGDSIRLEAAWPILAVSASGALMYLPAGADRALTWVDREQRAVPAHPKKAAWGRCSSLRTVAGWPWRLAPRTWTPGSPSLTWLGEP